jgi:hypothetical protein
MLWWTCSNSWKKTEIGERPGAGTIKVDSWDLERLDQSTDEDGGTIGDGFK